MSAPAPFPRTPASGASTDPRWVQCPKCGWGLTGCTCAREDCAMAWPSTTAGTTTITPPSPAEPSPEPHPADHRLVAIERACATLQRQALIIAEWAQYIAHQARKARQS
jgi:hypothetical protein